MRFIILIILLCSFVPSSKAQEKNLLSAEDQVLLDKDLAGVLRGFVWGLPPTVILENEKGTFIGEEKGSLFFYLDYIRGLKSTIGYEFFDNKLWRARIFIEKRYTDTQNRIRDLLIIQEALTKRYGKPIKEDFKWIDETDKNFPKSWGWAVYRGDLLISVTWQNEETEVTAYLGAKIPYEPELTITYVDRQVLQSFTKNKERKLLQAP